MTGRAKEAESSLRKVRLFMVVRLRMISNRFGFREWFFVGRSKNGLDNGGHFKTKASLRMDGV